MARIRKARSDRNHAIYVITCVTTGEQYIGLTVVSGGVKKALKVRIQKHVRRAVTENRDWTLCRAIREQGVENFTYGLIDVVRGKQAAHDLEQALVKAHQPVLNTFYIQ